MGALSLMLGGTWLTTVGLIAVLDGKPDGFLWVVIGLIASGLGRIELMIERWIKETTPTPEP